MRFVRKVAQIVATYHLESDCDDERIEWLDVRDYCKNSITDQTTRCRGDAGFVDGKASNVELLSN